MTTTVRPDAGTALRVPLESIDVGTNVRELDPDHVDRLARSIELRGLIVPLTVRPVGDGYALVAGWHRHAALKKAGFIEADVLSREEEAPSGDTAAENIVRKDLTPLGEANAIAAIHLERRVFEKRAPSEGFRNLGDRKHPRAANVRDANLTSRQEVTATGPNLGSSSAGLDESPRGHRHDPKEGLRFRSSRP